MTATVRWECEWCGRAAHVSEVRAGVSVVDLPAGQEWRLVSIRGTLLCSLVRYVRGRSTGDRIGGCARAGTVEVAVSGRGHL